MDAVRCPYCVEGDEFKEMSLVGVFLVCGKCGHKIVPDQPTFTCYCPKCLELNKPLQSEQRDKRRM